MNVPNSMSTLHVTRGLPACGKTTWARSWVEEDRAHRARVNRDDVRGMVDGGVFVKGVTETRIVAARDALITTLLSKGVDVVCDDTNLPARSARDLTRIAAKAGAEVQVTDMTDVDVEECVRRDAIRSAAGQRAVGAEVIRDLHARFVKGNPHPLPLPDTQTGQDNPAAAASCIPVAAAPRAVLVDVDGTVAFMNGRSPYDWTRVGEDTPNRAVIDVVRAMHAAGNRVVFLSGRDAVCRDTTERWLTEHVGVPYDALLMRPAGDTRQDAVVKTELFDTHVRRIYDVVCVLDDRKQIVDAWRAIGLTVLQVAEGDF